MFRVFVDRARSESVRVLSGLCLLALVPGCTKNGPGAPTGPSALSPTSVTVSLVAVNPGYQATAVAAFSDGSSREVTTEVQWSSSNPAVASVSATGRVTPVSVGSTEIRAAYQAVTGSAALTVSEPAALAPNYRFSGTILDSLDQVPISGVRVSVFSDDHSVDTFVWTDSQGGYEIRASSASPTLPVTLLTRKDGYAPQTVRRIVSGGELTLDLGLEPVPFTLSGTVKDNFDLNVPKCEPTLVTVMDGPSAGDYTVVPRVPADGSYDLPNVQPGTYTVRASAPGYYIREATARLRGFSPLNRLNFLLPRGPRPADLSRVDCSLPPLQ